MSTRFYFVDQSAGVTPAVDAGWENTASLFRRRLYRQGRLTSTVAAVTPTITTGVTEDAIALQMVSTPIPPQEITGTVSLVTICSENDALLECTLAVVIRVVSNDGSVVRGTLYSNFNIDTEFTLNASPSTRIVNAQAVTPVTTLPGDRIVVEVGAHAASPTATNTIRIYTGNNNATDCPLTSGDTNLYNPWVEFSQDLFKSMPTNYLKPRPFKPGNAR